MLVGMVFALNAASETIICQDQDARLSIDVDHSTKTVSFRYEKDGAMPLTGTNAEPLAPGDYPSLLVSEGPLAGGGIFYSLISTTSRNVWVLERTRYVLSRGGALIPYTEPAHWEVNVLRWFNGLFSKIDENYYFYRVDGENFGLPSAPITQGTRCSITE
jgi:hypothetical protein